jgi:hypothetical protein
MSLTEFDCRFWHEFDAMSQHFIDPTIAWEPKTSVEAAYAELIRSGELADSGYRRRAESGKLQIVWITVGTNYEAYVVHPDTVDAVKLLTSATRKSKASR